MTSAPQLQPAPQERRDVDAPPPPQTSPPKSRSLKRLAMAGSAWTLGGYAVGQGLRLGSNIVLARLLFPEAFGLMLLVNVFMQGLQMFSDIGVAPSIIQSKRGEDPAFLNTAWTIQVLRGLALWGIACAAAWPFGIFMEKPKLALIIPVAGLTALILGFQSTAVPLLNRRLSLSRVTLWELSSQVISVAVMIGWALIDRSVWALVAGGLAAAVFRSTSSHFLVAGHRNRLGWDRAAASSLFRFGRWIFFSTVLTFFAMQLDKLMMGKMLSKSQLGVYSIAVMMAMFSTRLVKNLGGRVGFPALAEVARERPHRLRRNLRSMRLALIGVSSLVLLPMIVGGHWLIELLYDDRYVAAGWMLQLLAAGGIITAVSSSSGQALMALGHSGYISLLLVTQLAFLVGMMLIGHTMAGTAGVVIGIASAELLNYPVTAMVLRKFGLWQPELDVPIILVGALVLAVGLTLSGGPFVGTMGG